MNYHILENIEPKFLKIEGIKLENSEFIYERINKKDATCVLLLNEDKTKFFLVKQFRAGIGREVWEIPAGILEKNLSTTENTLKEIEEETGYRPSDIEGLHLMYKGMVSPGYTSETMYIFSANIRKGALPHPLKLEENELITETGFFSLEEAEKLGAFKCMKTFLAANLYFKSN